MAKEIKEGSVREALGSMEQKLDGTCKLLREGDSKAAIEDGERTLAKNEERKWEDDPIKIPELGLKITSKDYFEILPDGTKKEYFTWDEAMEIEKKTNGKWRLPTVAEMVKICYFLGEKDGDLDRDTLVETLGLEMKGWKDDGNVYGKGIEGNWWMVTETAADYARYLLTNTTYVYPRVNGHKGNGFSVRCVASAS